MSSTPLTGHALDHPRRIAVAFLSSTLSASPTEIHGKGEKKQRMRMLVISLSRNGSKNPLSITMTFTARERHDSAVRTIERRTEKIRMVKRA
jgi:hypothetical protein